MSERAIGGQGDDNIKCHPFFEVSRSRKGSTVETKSKFGFFLLGKLKLCTAPNRRVGGRGNVGKAGAGPESTSYSFQATTTTPLLFFSFFHPPNYTVTVHWQRGGGAARGIPLRGGRRGRKRNFLLHMYAYAGEGGAKRRCVRFLFFKKRKPASWENKIRDLK